MQINRDFPDLMGCEKLGSLRVRDSKKPPQLRGLEKLDLIDLDIFSCDSLEAISKRVFRNYERELSFDFWSDVSSTEVNKQLTIIFLLRFMTYFSSPYSFDKNVFHDRVLS